MLLYACLKKKASHSYEIGEAWHTVFRLVHKLSSEYVKFMKNEINERERSVRGNQSDCNRKGEVETKRS